jgi:hypothetical protein
MRWAACLFLWMGLVAAAQPGDQLKQSFKRPPREYTLVPLWAWNGALTKDKLIWQIDQMVDKGVYGAFMHARAGLNESGTPYFSEGFWKGVEDSVGHASKVGFQTWLYDEDKWPSGAAGGRTLRANPQRNAATGLSHESLVVKGPAQIAIRFPGAEFIVAAQSLGGNRIDSKTLTDLTALNHSEGETWNVPAGEWRLCVFRLFHEKGWPLPNYLNPDTVKEFLNNTYEQYAVRVGSQFGKAIPGVYFDEIYNLVLAWDPLLEERFKVQKGYDLRKSLPLLYHDGGPETIQTRCDYFEVFAKLYEDAWFRQISEWCERHNLKWTGHTNEWIRSIKDQGDYFRTIRRLQIPGTDNEDFRYTFPRVIASWKPKQLSSIAHLYGKRRAMVEALAGPGWPLTLEEGRYGVNMLAAFGMNFFVFYGFHYAMDQPQSMDDWPNSWFYQNPYWKYFKKVADYVSRVSFMGSQGEHVAGVAILYPIEDVWSQGLTPRPARVVPGLATADTAREPVVVQMVDRLVEAQIDCDVVDTDSLLKAVPAGQGRARIGAESYQVLLLPAVETVSLAAYRRIHELAQNGLKVAAVGVVPRNSAEHGRNDPEVLRISEKLFGRQARVLGDGDALMSWVRAETDPDVQVISGPPKILRYSHRRADDRDIYWLVNSEKRAGRWTVRLAATGHVEKWDPNSGQVTPVAGSGLSVRDTTLDLELGPWEASYFVFDRSVRSAGRTPDAGRLGGAKPAPLELSGPWTFQLAPKELDEAWKPDPGETSVRLPVLEVRIERPPDSAVADSGWRRIKITDALNPLKGAARYLTAWDAAWITRYTWPDFNGELGGPALEFKKELDLRFEPASAWLTIAADERFECRINGERVAAGQDWSAPVTLDSLPLRQGPNVIEVKVLGPGYLLAQGELRGRNGERVHLATGRDWKVKAPQKDWLAAYEFAFPPFGRWRDLPLRGKTQSLPVTVWYRGPVPPGARWMERPVVRGNCQIRLNGRPVTLPEHGALALPPGLPPNSTVALGVEVARLGDGLQDALVFRCRPAQASLGDWRNLGLEWYSGRAVYRTEFRLPASHAGRKLILDLGDLRYSGEVWLNDQLVETLVWPPYRADISRHARAGRNTLVVVAANLLANEMRWNIFDAAIPYQLNRWWHDGNILREPDKLRSGLLGPVRILID